MSNNKEYIERGWISGVLPPTCPYGDEYSDGYNTCLETVKSLIRDAPAADVVEVVRCEKCAKYQIIKTQTCTIAGCRRTGFTSCNPDDYCSYGARKENSE